MTETIPDTALIDGFNEYGALRRVAICPASEAYRSQSFCDETWETAQFLGKPDFAEAEREYAGFVEALDAHGCEIEMIPAGPGTGMNAIYARDSAIVSPAGLIIGNLANPPRTPEANGVAQIYENLNLPIAGRIKGDGLLEGGDFVWFDDKTCAVAYGCRTNREGIRQLKELLGPDVHVEVVGLPWWEGPATCLHLMSFISPVAEDLAVIYPRLMPMPFMDFLRDRGIEFVEVPDEEYEPGFGCNVLATGPRRVIMIDGNPVTRKRMEAAGCDVTAVKAEEISLKGGGGPTCLTRPLLRG